MSSMLTTRLTSSSTQSGGTSEVRPYRVGAPSVRGDHVLHRVRWGRVRGVPVQHDTSGRGSPVMYTEALVIACTPGVAFIGAALSYYGFTERGDHDPVPRVRRGESSFEPWWAPIPARKFVLPGEAVIALPRDHGLDDKTQEHTVIYDERTSSEVPRG